MVCSKICLKFQHVMTSQMTHRKRKCHLRVQSMWNLDLHVVYLNLTDAGK